MISRVISGVVVAACIAIVANRARALAGSGAVAATIVGSLAVAAGWERRRRRDLLRVLDAPRVGRATKERRTASIVAKGGVRDAVQVLANGGVFAGAAIAMVVRPDMHCIALGAGALAVLAADTWATEVGTLWQASRVRFSRGGAFRRARPAVSRRSATMAAVAGRDRRASSQRLVGRRHLPRTSPLAASQAPWSTHSSAQRSRPGAGAPCARRKPNARRTAHRRTRAVGSHGWTMTSSIFSAPRPAVSLRSPFRDRVLR